MQQNTNLSVDDSSIIMKYSFLFLFFAFLSCIPARAQQKIDLANIQFTENVKALLKGISYTKRERDNHRVYYVISNKKAFTYAGIPIDAGIELGAQNNIVFSCYINTDKTVTTNRLQTALLAKYRQPTKKVRDDENGKAYYWQTPTLFVQFMTGKIGISNIQFSSFIHIAPLRAFQTGADPDFKHVYDLVKAF
jgi:hypothetical protein